MEEFEVRRRGMQTTEEWCIPVSKILHHMKRGLVGFLEKLYFHQLKGEFDKLRLNDYCLCG